MAAGAVLLAYAVLPDPAASWQSVLENIMEMANLRSQISPDISDADFDERMGLMGRMMTRWYAATLFLFAAFSLLLARAWQARLYNVSNGMDVSSP